MKNTDEWSKFIARTENFYWKSELIKQQMQKYRPYYESLCDFKNSIFSNLNQIEKRYQKNLLNTIFNIIYNNTTDAELYFTSFRKESFLHENVYDACLFSTLCMFLHETKRMKGKSLRSFVYDNSPDGYDSKNSKNYCAFNALSQAFYSNETTLRQQRYRILSSRPVYNMRPEGSAMSYDSEYEWTFKYILQNQKESIQDTFKRIGNLYNDIHKALTAPQDDAKSAIIESAYKKFLSKLKKINYENYLEIQQLIFDHICKNDKFYGINLYRAEKELRIYITTNEVEQLNACETKADEESILKKSVILNDICFPKVYRDFASLPFYSDISNCASFFYSLCDYIIPANCLIIDELIENNCLGEDWCDFLSETINEMAKKIFYNPKEINYNITPKSQESFMKILSSMVKYVIFIKKGITLP